VASGEMDGEKEEKDGRSGMFEDELV